MKIEPFMIDPKPFLDLKSKFWTVFDILRSENIASMDYYVVLFLLSLYKEKFIKPEMIREQSDIAGEIESILKESDKEDSKQYLQIYQSFEPVMTDISKQGFFSIIEVICELDHKTLSKNFPELFDSVLYNLAQSQGRYGGEFIQPLEVTQLISGLFKLPKNARVYNPFAGLASFGVNLYQGQYYFGQEIDQKTCALGVLRIMAYERPGISEYACDDSILNWPDESQKFDLIVSNPPYGLRLDKKYSDVKLRVRTAEQFLVEKGLNSLTDDGKLIALLPQGFFFRGIYEEHLRKFLVDEDLLDTIISLPGGLLSNIGTPLIILVVNKKKELPGKVRFIKSDKFVESRSLREKFLNVYALNGLIQGNRVDGDALKIVGVDQIQESDYNLHVPRYFQKDVELEKHERLVKLKDILEYVRGHRGNLPGKGKLVRSHDLKDDKLDFLLDVSSVEEKWLTKLDIPQLSESSLLLAVHSRTLKPTYFEYDGTPIYKGQDILSFKVDESIADHRYVINELHADYVQEQLESYRMGGTIPFIRKNDLLEIAIKLPFIDEQRAKIQGIVELSDKIKILQEQRNALVHGLSNKVYESVSTIKHSLGKPLLNIGSSLRNIEKAMSKLNAEWDKVKLNERYDVTIKDSFDSIYSNLALIHSELGKNEIMRDYSGYKLAEIDFLSFIKSYVKSVKSADRANVNTILDIHPDIKIQLNNKILLNANSKLLEIALNTIVENANMHGFSDNSKRYKLEFRVSLYVASSVKKQSDETTGRFDNYIKVEIANNGTPFPENYALDKLIRKNSFAGKTGNTGQGGFDLNEIIKYHNDGKSTLELITDDPTTEFTTTYSFLIPLIG